VKAAAPTAERPDLGIGTEDIKLSSDSIAVTVHSLGAKSAEGGTAELVDAKGQVLVRVSIPALAAPLDLAPKTATVNLPLKPGAAGVRIALPVPEVTALNNAVALPGVPPVKSVRRVKH